MHRDLVPLDAACLLFDWDGTLVDSQNANYRAMAAALRRVHTELDQDWFNARTGLSSDELLRTLLRERGLTTFARPISEIVATRDRLFLDQAHTVRPHPAVAAVVDAMRHRVPMAIASGGARPTIEATLRHQPFHDAFDIVVTRGDVDRGKPAPDIFLVAAERLGIPASHCLVYEDSDEGITAAHAAGMRVIDVRPFNIPSDTPPPQAEPHC